MKHTRCILYVLNVFYDALSSGWQKPQSHSDLHLLQLYTKEQAVNGSNMAVSY